MSTYVVPDAALKRACYVLRFLLADRRVLRRYLYRHYGRIGIVGAREGMFLGHNNQRNLHKKYQNIAAIKLIHVHPSFPNAL